MVGTRAGNQAENVVNMHLKLNPVRIISFRFPVHLQQFIFRKMYLVKFSQLKSHG